MDNYLKKASATKAPGDLLELTSEDRFTNFDRENDLNIDEPMPEQSLDLNFGENNDKDFIHQIFDAGMNLEDEHKEDNILMTPEDSTSSNPKTELSGVKRKAKKDTLSNGDSFKEPVPKPKESGSKAKEPKAKSKVRMSDKERARKSRQRKKKYYEDLENKVGGLEELCKKLSKELMFYKNKVRIYELNEKKGDREVINKNCNMIDKIIEKVKE